MCFGVFFCVGECHAQRGVNGTAAISALSGIYTIVDGFFVGNSIGDIGLSAVNGKREPWGIIRGIQ